MNSDFVVAVHALVYLNHKADVVSSEALADNICTNAARVRKVMAPLKRAGFVETREGSVGGYRFAADPAKTDLKQVAFDSSSHRGEAAILIWNALWPREWRTSWTISSLISMSAAASG